MAPIIEVENLHQRYGDVVAVDEVSFSVHEGEIFGIIGPNGAGKTTTAESVIGLRKPDRGRISVLGMDPIRERTALAERIGVQLQEAALAERIKVWEALDLFSSFYRRTVPWQPLLQQWGLADKRNAMFANLSGGQRQRLFIALHPAGQSGRRLPPADRAHDTRLMAAIGVATTLRSYSRLASFVAVGYVIASLVRSDRVALLAVGMAIYFPLMFLSGAAMPLETMPENVRQVARWLPLTHVVQLLRDFWFGLGWNWGSGSILLGMLVAGTAVSAALFRWE